MAGWLIGWTLFIRERCHGLLEGGMTCRHDPGGVLAFLGDFVRWTPLQVYLLGLVVPLAGPVIGLVVMAIARPRRRGSR